MTAITVYECDGCGERFGYTNTLVEFPLVCEAAHLYVAPETETLLACHDCISDGPSERELYHTGHVEAWGVGRLRDLVTGVLVHHEDLSDPQFTQRADLSHEAEAVAEFIEEALL